MFCCSGSFMTYWKIYEWAATSSSSSFYVKVDRVSRHIGKCVFPRSQSGRDPMIDFTCFDGISHHHHHHLIEPLSSSSSSSSSSSRSSMWAAEIWWWIEVVLPQPLWPNYFLQTPMMRVIGCCWRWFVIRWSDHCGNGDWFLDEIDQYVSLGT